MNKFVAFLIFWSVPVILMAGCSLIQAKPEAVVRESLVITPEELKECIDDQVDLYGDLCAESSSGYEEMSGSDAHFTGVECAVDSIKSCLSQ